SPAGNTARRPPMPVAADSARIPPAWMQFHASPPSSSGFASSFSFPSSLPVPRFSAREVARAHPALFATNLRSPTPPQLAQPAPSRACRRATRARSRPSHSSREHKLSPPRATRAASRRSLPASQYRASRSRFAFGGRRHRAALPSAPRDAAATAPRSAIPQLTFRNARAPRARRVRAPPTAIAARDAVPPAAHPRGAAQAPPAPRAIPPAPSPRAAFLREPARALQYGAA